jgi:acyl carrier protein
MSDDVSTIVRTVLSTFAPEADMDELDPNAQLQEALDLDSMDFLNAMIGIHEATGVDIPEADYGEVSTLDRLVRYVSERVPSG